MAELTLARIVELVNGTLTGDPGVAIHRVAEIEHAGEGEITFLSNSKYEKFLATTKASCVLVQQSQSVDRAELNLIRVEDPYAAFMVVQRVFAPPAPVAKPGVHPNAVVDPTSSIQSTASIGAYCVIGENAIVGNNTVLHSNVVLGANVTVGIGSTLNANVTIYHGCKIGDNVIIHSGTVIGADGFGYTENKEGRYDKIPQNGTVVIGDDVEIGANCAIDRAAIGETRIGRGCKIDNLVMIAHNVVIGEDTLIVAQAGVSGSTKIGRHVVLAGQAGVSGHMELVDNVIVSAQSGVSKSLMKPGLYIGSPALPAQTSLRAAATVRQLPELIQQVAALTARVKELEALVTPDQKH